MCASADVGNGHGGCIQENLTGFYDSVGEVSNVVQVPGGDIEVLLRLIVQCNMSVRSGIRVINVVLAVPGKPIMDVWCKQSSLDVMRKGCKHTSTGKHDADQAYTESLLHDRC